MSQIKLALMGIGLVGLGICSVIWYFVKLISCIMIAGLISTKICNLSGMYWWFSSVIIFCLITKVLFLNNSSVWYNDLNTKYNKKVKEENNVGVANY